jgi:hypothetical protein
MAVTRGLLHLEKTEAMKDKRGAYAMNLAKVGKIEITFPDNIPPTQGIMGSLKMNVCYSMLFGIVYLNKYMF